MLVSVFNFLWKSFQICANPRTPFPSRGWLISRILLASLLLDCAGASAGTASAPAPSDAAKLTAANYGKIPLSFEPNKGQTDPSVKFLSRGSGYSLFLTKDEVVLNLERQSGSATDNVRKPASVDTLRMKLMGASANSAVTGLDTQTSTVSYLIGNDPKKWHTGIETFGKVNFAQVYPGVDLVFYGNQRQLEYDFVVAAGADASRIAWQIDGAKPTIDADGNLVLSAANGPAGFKKPVLYQMDGGKKIAVEGAFTVAGNRIGFQLGSYDHAKPLIIDPVLTYATYLGGSTNDYLGGSQSLGNSGLQVQNVGQGIAYDGQGSAYVVGVTYSTDFPVQNPALSAPVKANLSYAPPSAVVTKFSPDGSSLVYSTYLGGTYQDYGEAITVDSNGEAFVVGQTHSSDFPVTSGAFQTICAPYANDEWSPDYTPVTSCGAAGYGNGAAFVTKLNAAGSGLVYSTFLGGYGTANANAITIDSAGRAYVGGTTSWLTCQLDYSQNILPFTCFPTTSGAVVSGQDANAGTSNFQGFISVIDPTGSSLLYSSMFIPLNPACQWNKTTGIGRTLSCPQLLAYVNGVALDADGNFYIVGNTNGTSLPTTAGVIQPTTGPVQSTNPLALQLQRGFVAKFNPVTASGGASLAYSTYLGGQAAGGSDTVANITTDAQGNAYVVGGTASLDFPVTTGAYQTSCPSWAPWGDSGPTVMHGQSAFVAKLNPTGTAIEWATYLGAALANQDSVGAVGPVQLDGNGNVYTTGKANGGNFPWVGNMEPYNGYPVFVSELDPTGSKLIFSTEFGTGLSDNMTPAGLAVDTAGNMYLAMDDNCAGTIVTPGSFQQTNHMQSSGCAEFSTTGFVAKISATGTVTVTLAASPSPASAGQSTTLTATVTPTATYASVPTGTIEFQDGSSALGTAVTLDSTGKATYTSTTLAPGTHSLTAVYSGDSTYPAGNAAQSLVVNGLTASVKVTPSPASITTAMSLSVTVAVTGSGATPTGTVTLSGGGYNSSAATLSGGSASITIPANSLSAGSDTLTVSYSGDANYSPATGTSAAPETVTTPLTPTVKVTPSPASITTAMSLSVTVAVTGSGATPTGTVTLSGGGYTSSAATLSGGSASITIPANSLSVGSDTLTVSYSGDANYGPATGSASETVTTPLTANVKVAPAATTVVSASSLSVKVTVTGGGATPTGTVTLSGGGYTSAATTLVGGIATIVIPANSLSAGNDTLTATYSGDSNYAAATGAKAGTAPVTVSATPLPPTVTVTPAATTMDSGSTLSVSVAVTGAGVTPTGTVTLSGGGYTSTTQTLTGGAYTFSIPANSLSAGTDTLTASYSGDSNYTAATGTTSGSTSPTVTASAFSLAASTPAAVASGSPATSTVTVSTATAYSGTVTLTCALTTSPAGATHLPTCSGGSSTITLGGGTTSGTATVTVSSTTNSAMARPENNGFGRGWAGSGAVMAILFFFGIPARRRRWLSMLGVLTLMVVLGGLSACGGKSTSSGTTAGSYTFTVTGTGSPAETPVPTTTFTLTIN